ncbi:hypothetical protein [Winogradskyella sp. R77965]|uniref:hypothetical protein n=1 Tax=Winogradskyella sp. R77965 TaxID=3093872 RepID=UPI0037DD2514
MKKIIVSIFSIISIGSCSDDESINCSVIGCFGGDIIEVIFLENDQNILTISPETEITMTQNSASLDFYINTMNNQITIFLSAEDPINIVVGGNELNMEISSTFVEGECCGGIKVDSLTIDNLEICNGESCNEVLSVNVD